MIEALVAVSVIAIGSVIWAYIEDHKKPARK
jgi:hypothetical protein